VTHRQARTAADAALLARIASPGGLR
jgi:hypothetical protein